MNPLLAQLDKQVGSLRGCRVVELGAIAGLVSLFHVEEVASLTVVEPSQDLIAKVSESLAPEQTRFQIHRSELSQLAFVGIESVDVCISSFGAASSSDSERLFRQVKRILRPSGAFVFSVPHPLIGHRAFQELPLDHNYFETSLVDTRVLQLGFEAPGRISVKPLSKVFAELKKVGLYVDTFEEVSLEGGRIRSKMPDFAVLKCKKL